MTIKSLIAKLEKRYEDEFKYRKRNIKDDSLNVRDNEGLYDAGFINGMRSLLMQIIDYKYDYITTNELEQIVKENKGVDPITIQKELEDKIEASLNISEIINLLNRN